MKPPYIQNLHAFEYKGFTVEPYRSGRSGWSARGFPKSDPLLGGYLYTKRFTGAGAKKSAIDAVKAKIDARLAG